MKTLAEWRKDDGRTQQECAEAIGVSRQSWAGWEAGRMVPGRDNMRRLRELTGGDVTADSFHLDLVAEPETVAA